MNKLYKYLPFGIKGVVGKVQKIKIELLGIKEDKAIIIADEFKHGNMFRYCNLNEFKPILRPFEDLTKELPLTKAAAEMIGMKEGELVRPIQVVSWLYFEGNELAELNEWKFGYNDWTGVNLESWFFVRMDNKKLRWRETSYNNTYFNLFESEKAFDFLRAMHFAVGLNEDEYIRYETH